jgi:tetratricopeptide (TPR) repeat protein
VSGANPQVEALEKAAIASIDAGDYEIAEPLYKRALAITEKVLGPEHPGVATSLTNFAWLYWAQARLAEAEPLTKRALAIREKVLGPGHPEVASELPLLGELQPRQAAPAHAQRAPAASTINLLSAKNGGAVLIAPQDSWLSTADDKEDDVRYLAAGSEAVYAFKDEAPATFHTFAVLVKGEGANPKEIELFAGDDGPTGTFRSITTCTFLNARVTRTPYQECKFAPVTARYLKAKILSSYGGDFTLATEWRLLGTPRP